MVVVAMLVLFVAALCSVRSIQQWEARQKDLTRREKELAAVQGALESTKNKAGKVVALGAKANKIMQTSEFTFTVSNSTESVATDIKTITTPTVTTTTKTVTTASVEVVATTTVQITTLKAAMNFVRKTQIKLKSFLSFSQIAINIGFNTNIVYPLVFNR